MYKGIDLHFQYHLAQLGTKTPAGVEQGAKIIPLELCKPQW